MRKLLTVMILPLIVALFLLSCADEEQEAAENESFDIAVFVPGVVEGSPTYEMLVAGVERAAGEREGTSVQVVEGGFNQGEWLEGVTSLAADGRYELIVSSNPSLPEISAEVAQSYPEERFLILDGYLDENPAVHTVIFNQREQAFLVGHFAGLVTRSSLDNTNDLARVGLLAGQEYPIMNNVILPAYELGLRTVLPQATVDFRVLGNWFDATSAAELANSMIANGADVILTIAGGGNQGVIASARENEAYVLWFDDAGYEEAPGIVIGASVVRLDRAAYERTLSAIDGELDFGEAAVLGVADGYVDFATENPLYERHVPSPIREAQQEVIDRMRRGELDLEMPLSF
jgi:simple sugar transport system substrate-binding protein